MKTKILLTCLLLTAVAAQAQLKIGIKAGPNFATIDGLSDVKMRTGIHFGAFAEVKLSPNFAVQPEVLYSMQGAKIDREGFEDIKFDYLTVPVVAKFYLISDLLSLEAGPQFSFLVNDNAKLALDDPSTFDFAVVGGLGINITKSLIVQGRYVVGLTDASTDALRNADYKNHVIQISVGYAFF